MNAEELQGILEKHAKWLSNEPGGQCALLSLANLSSANLEDADLRYASLDGANLLGAHLSSARLEGADLCGANLRYANLLGADLRGADLEGATLCGAKLRCADLSGASLERADLRYADLSDADLWRANLAGANLSGANLRGADLSCANLAGADLRDALMNWQSRDLIAELLVRGAGNDIEKLKLAGLVLLWQDWCWSDFLRLGDPLQEWALKELARWVQPGDIVPEAVQQYVNWTAAGGNEETTGGIHGYSETEA